MNRLLSGRQRGKGTSGRIRTAACLQPGIYKAQMYTAKQTGKAMGQTTVHGQRHSW